MAKCYTFDIPSSHNLGGFFMERNSKGQFIRINGTKIIHICKNCNKKFEYYETPSGIKRGGGKFCNKSCQGKYAVTICPPWLTNIGKKSSNNRQIKFICIICERTYFKSPYHKEKTKTCSNECRIKYTAKIISGEQNWIWKGDRVGYGALHNWVKRQLGKAIYCENDNSHRGVFHWANKSGEYKRDVSDWKQLCPPCHSSFDEGKNSIKKTFNTSNGRPTTRL